MFRTDERESGGGKRERAGALTVAVVCVIALPALYLFATGPIDLMIDRKYIGDRGTVVVQWIYAPVIYLAERSQTFANVLEAWCNLWN